MKIAFVHEVNYRTKVVFEMHEFPELLAAAGHDVTFFDYPEGEKGGRLDPSARRSNTNRSGTGAPVNLVRPPIHFPGTIGRLLFAAAGWIWLLIELRRLRPNVVVLYGVPTNGWQTILICRRLNIPVVYRMIDLSHGLRSTIFAPLVKRAEASVVRGSNLILSNNAALAEYAASIRGSNEDIKVLAPGVKGVDEHEWGTSTCAGSAVVVFMGTLFRFSGLDWFMRSATQNDGKLDFKLLVLGDGESRAAFEQTARELGIGNEIEFRGFIPFADLNAHLAEAALAILPFESSEVAELALPGKVPQYLVGGLPVVSTPLAGLKSFLSDGEGVVYCHPGMEFVQKVRQLLGDSSARESLLKRGRDALSQRASWTSSLASFEDHLKRVANS